MFPRGGGTNLSQTECLDHSCSMCDAKKMMKCGEREDQVISKRIIFKKVGFTLAEVLITLAIIGVVSALTVPGLMNSYQKQTYVTQLHKYYNETMQAAKLYLTDRNAIDLKEAGLVNQAAVDTWVKTYFKIVQDCGTSGINCFAVGEYKKLNGQANAAFQSTAYNHYVLASGVAIAVRAYSTGNTEIYLDVNGKKGPNILGRDVFATMLYSNGTIDDWDGTGPAPLSTTIRETLFQSYCNNTTSTWWGCFGKILNDNWQMNY